MNIILISDVKKRSFMVELRPVTLCLVISFVVVSAGAVFYTGYQLASQESINILNVARQQTQSVWQSEIDAQRENLSILKTNTEKSVDAMAGRLSVLQGYVMRLDALGSRLAAMAKLDDIEFGVANPPGLGGPSSDASGTPVSIPDLLTTFDEMEYILQDRSEKLTAMESMLINRTLQEETSPGGKPSMGGYLSSLFGYRTDPVSGSGSFMRDLIFR